MEIDKSLFDVSAIIINYKNAELTISSVRAFETAANKAGKRCESIIIDNSALTTGNTMREFCGEARILILNNNNRGFSVANNQGIQKAKGECLLIVNNDAFTSAESLEIGLKYLADNPDTGIWAPRLTYMDGRFQNSVGVQPSLWSHFTEYLVPARFLSLRQLDKQESPRRVDTVSGAFMLIPRAIMADLGGFDEDYFFTVEDVDLCVRMKKAGHSVVYDPRVSVVHIGGSGQSWKWLNDPYMHKARLLYFKKNHGRLIFMAASAITWLGLNIRKLLLKWSSAHA